MDDVNFAGWEVAYVAALTGDPMPLDVVIEACTAAYALLCWKALSIEEGEA